MQTHGENFEGEAKKGMHRFLIQEHRNSCGPAVCEDKKLIPIKMELAKFIVDVIKANKCSNHT